MQKNNHFSFLFNLLFPFLKLFVIVLFLMSLLRVYIFFSYSARIEYYVLELLNTFWLGMRLDISILAYIFSVPILVVFFVWAFRLEHFHKYLHPIFHTYFIFLLTFLAVITFADVVYFSFFGKHATLMIFSVFDDDTKALFQTALANYNLPLVISLAMLFLALLYSFILQTIKKKKRFHLEWQFPEQIIFFFLLISLILLLARGSLGIFPLAKDVSDVSADTFLNKLPQTAGYAMLNSYEQYIKSKSENYDLIKNVGYTGKIEKAFEVYKQSEYFDKANFLNNLLQTTPKNEIIEMKKPNVIVVMVESFGMPLLDYQTKKFNILGKLKKHFDEDILFTNFISSSNGTISSLEPLLLNITARPNSTPFAQSPYLNTSFTQASAKVYQDAGYETSFIYGGDLLWRNVGAFMSKQGFEHVEGRAVIANALNRDTKSISHQWGVFDEYLHKYVELKLQNATKPQFIFMLTTNNHPPYTIPRDYRVNSLLISKNLKNHISGDLGLAKLRFKDYAYALDSLGSFMNGIKNSSFAQNTVVAITADNNTIEGIMKYDNHYTQTKKIPFYIYLPDYLKPNEEIDTTVASSHKDIFPTLYNLTLSDVTYTAIGTNLLDTQTLHCGFNDEGILITNEGGFRNGKAITQKQKKCQEYYKASLAVTEYLIRSHKKQ